MDFKNVPVEEVWRSVEIEGFNHYEVSSHGRVRSKERIYRYEDGTTRSYNRYVRKLFMCSRGFVCVGLYSHELSKMNTVRIHQLVASHFMQKPSDSHRIVYHLDGDKTNNSVSNLLYVRAVRGSKYFI